jgi:hypothetical protein
MFIAPLFLYLAAAVLAAAIHRLTLTLAAAAVRAAWFHQRRYLSKAQITLLLSVRAVREMMGLEITEVRHRHQA